MFTIDDIFSQLFPWLEGISIDLGTILVALVFLGFLVLGFDYVTMMLGVRMRQNNYSEWAGRYSFAADRAKEERDSWDKGSTEWLEQDMVYRKFINKAADARVKGWKY